MVALTYSAFMYYNDPYVLIKPDYFKKILPYSPMYNYNFIRQYEKIDYGFLGSSAVNYFPIDYMYPGYANLYSMGIESSNISEHIAYGKVLAGKNPKEIVFFITFYALNPARGNQNYFHPLVVKMNNIVIDFVDQYFNNPAYDDAVEYRRRLNQDGVNWMKEFNPNGTRTQNSYRTDKNYNAEKTFQNYLSYMLLDPRYYGSHSFKKPESVNIGIGEIKEFRDYLKSKGVKLKIATAPEHRMNIALIYFAGLGETYEAFRRKLASVQPYYDLNLDTAFTSNIGNFWDTHHVRKGKKIIEDLNNDVYLMDSSNVDQYLPVIRPGEREINKLKLFLKNYKDWNKTREKLKEDLSITPPVMQ